MATGFEGATHLSPVAIVRLVKAGLLLVSWTPNIISRSWVTAKVWFEEVRRLVIIDICFVIQLRRSKLIYVIPWKFTAFFNVLVIKIAAASPVEY